MKPSKIYQNHRDNQRERILEVAERLFIRDGIDVVSISSIASEARLTRATLYEYFPNKEEVAWAVFQKIIEDLNTPGEEFEQPGSGYQMIEQYLQHTVRLLGEHADHFSFIALFNFLYARQGSGQRMRLTLEQASAGGLGKPAEWLRAGIADGSIRADLDPDRAAAALHNLVAGLTHRFSLLGANIQDEFGYDALDLYREICHAFLRGIQPNPLNLNKENPL